MPRRQLSLEDELLDDLAQSELTRRRELLETDPDLNERLTNAGNEYRVELIIDQDEYDYTSLELGLYHWRICFFKYSLLGSIVTVANSKETAWHQGCRASSLFGYEVNQVYSKLIDTEDQIEKTWNKPGRHNDTFIGSFAITAHTKGPKHPHLVTSNIIETLGAPIKHHIQIGRVINLGSVKERWLKNEGPGEHNIRTKTNRREKVFRRKERRTFGY